MDKLSRSLNQGAQAVGVGFKMGIVEMTAHKLRSLLSLLGVLFGVAAMMAMLTLLGGAEDFVNSILGKWAGNVLHEDPIGIWNGRVLRELRTAHFSRKGTAFCSGCQWAPHLPPPSIRDRVKRKGITVYARALHLLKNPRNRTRSTTSRSGT